MKKHKKVAEVFQRQHALNYVRVIYDKESGITIAMIRNQGEQFYKIAWALCGNGDKFRKTTGALIALTRALDCGMPIKTDNPESAAESILNNIMFHQPWL